MSDLELAVSDAKDAVDELAQRATAAYDEGYSDGTCDAAEEYKKNPSEPHGETLRERYHYLSHGGSWDLQTNIEENKYLAGFLDAMKVLGVKP